MAGKRRKRSDKLGLAPGTLVHVGRESGSPPLLGAFVYDASTIDEPRLQAVRDLSRGNGRVAWLNVDGLTVDVVEQVGRLFDIHPLVLEDVLNTEQRPKCEDYGEYTYLALKMLSWDETSRGVVSEAVSLILCAGNLITFQERPGDVFDPVRQRLRDNKGRIRKEGADYLAYSLMDVIVDHYFLVLERLGDEVEAVEGDLVTRAVPATLRRIHDLKRTAIMLRRSVWPLREVLAVLIRGESRQFAKGTVVFLRDLYDHTIQIVDAIESQRDVIGGLLDVYLSTLSNRMNEIMKVLTIIATIFIPLTFIAGVYGMNFRYVPELQWHWGYAAVWGVMAFIGAGLIGFFRWKKWL